MAAKYKYKEKSQKAEEPSVFYGCLSKYESDISSNYMMLLNANKGLDASSFDDLIGITQGSRELFASRLSISIKTIDRYIKDNKKFDPQMSELVLKWIELYKKGRELFGSVKDFNRWLEKSNIIFDGMAPEVFMSTSGGIDFIKAELLRIEHGDIA